MNPYAETTRPENDLPRSACYDDLRFISTHPESVAEAIDICGGCTFRACVPVLQELLASPTDAAHVEGVWDGRYYSANSRRYQVGPIPHGTQHGARVHRGRDEKPCADCAAAEAAASVAKRARRKARGAA